MTTLILSMLVAGAAPQVSTPEWSVLGVDAEHVAMWRERMKDQLRRQEVMVDDIEVAIARVEVTLEQLPDGAFRGQARMVSEPAGQTLALTTLDAKDEAGLLEAIDTDDPVVLLIDEIDRADEEFEAFLLEVLSDFQVTIPELGTIHARERPYVILTSNRTRELHDALKRRCLYHWIEHPGLEREVQIVRTRAPEVSEELTRQVVGVVQQLRDAGLQKPPGVAETLDWARALHHLGTATLDLEASARTLGALVKYREDAQKVQHALDQLLRA